MTKYPFEATPEELRAELDSFVDAVFGSLGSEFLVAPRGEGFIEYAVFEQAYEALKRATDAFTDLDPDRVLPTALSTPLTLIVLRTMLGFTPPEWAWVATQRSGVAVSQGYTRGIDRKIRTAPFTPLRRANPRLLALVSTACELLSMPAPSVDAASIHRLDKADTKLGVESLRHLTRLGVPYAMLLYERFLGRPFAGHRDSVSELVGGALEVAIEKLLTERGIQFRKTARAERLPGFDQAPDFVVPDEFNVRVVIEAKLTEDDGTARDKVTRVQHLAALSRAGQESGRRFEVVACIAGRGFRVRREDMKKLLLATDGRVFTLQTLDQMVPYSGLQAYSTR